MPDTGKRLVLRALLALAGLRILSSYSWLSGAFLGKDAKFASLFLSGPGLVSRIQGGFVHTAVNAGTVSFLIGTVVPHASLFAWLLALGEAGVGISLLLGLFTRLGSSFAIVQCIVNMMVASGNGADTIGHNYLLIILALAFLVIPAGRIYGLDGWLMQRFPDWRWLQFVG